MHRGTRNLPPNPVAEHGGSLDWFVRLRSSVRSRLTQGRKEGRKEGAPFGKDELSEQGRASEGRGDGGGGRKTEKGREGGRQRPAAAGAAKRVSLFRTDKFIFLSLRSFVRPSDREDFSLQSSCSLPYSTEFPIPSCREVFRKSFREFPWLVGCYCS